MEGKMIENSKQADHSSSESTDTQLEREPQYSQLNEAEKNPSPSVKFIKGRSKLPPQKNSEPKSQTTYSLWLQNEYTQRCKRNPRYSLRSFARLLEMDPSSVSQIMTGKRNASHKVLNHLFERLSIPTNVRDAILQTKNNNDSLDSTTNHATNYQLLATDAFALIADWHHSAILEMIATPNFKGDAKWIAKKLGLTPTEISLALNRLERVGVVKIKGSTIKRTNENITNYEEGTTAPALKEVLRQLLNKALVAIDQTPADKKDITGIMMATDPAKIPEAKRRIKKFRRDLCKFLETGKKTMIFNLGVQLFPVSESLIDTEEKHENN